MKVLIIGSGGREHAIGWKLSKSPKVSKLFFAPGNGGTLKLGTNLSFKATDKSAIIKFAKNNKIDLVVVTPDDPLALGLVDDLEKEKIKAFGPRKNAAKIESSKAFAKQLMKEKKIPTASFKTFKNFKKAKKYLATQNFPLVIKASGLALGKGVEIVQSLELGVKSLEKIMVKNVLGDAGSEVVIEEFLEGYEISIHAFCDGKNYSLFPVSQDHKQIFDGDKGPNTGGMGTIAPVPKVDEKLIKEIEKKIIKPALEGLKKRGRKFKGILYPGIMVTKDGPKVLEFNARFGDPETESYMRLLKTDLYDIFNACVDGTLNSLRVEWENKFVCTVVLASKDYPGKYEKGFKITGIKEAEKDPDVVVFHAGTKNLNSSPELSTYFQLGVGKLKLVTDGGRVLDVTASGNSLDGALGSTYKAINKIHFKGMQYRRDIGKRRNLV